MFCSMQTAQKIFEDVLIFIFIYILAGLFDIIIMSVRWICIVHIRIFFFKSKIIIAKLKVTTSNMGVSVSFLTVIKLF